MLKVQVYQHPSFPQSERVLEMCNTEIGLDADMGKHMSLWLLVDKETSWILERRPHIHFLVCSFIFSPKDELYLLHPNVSEKTKS